MRLTKIVVMLPISDIKRSMEFYQSVLGFEVQSHHDEWGWAFLVRDGCGLMLDRSINSGKGRDAIAYLYTDDVDEYYRQVKKTGHEVEPPAVTFYKMREFRLTDPDGNELWIGNYAEEK